MQWTHAKRDAYLIKNLHNWCAEILAVAPEDIQLRKWRVKHRHRLSHIRVPVVRKAGAPRQLAFKVAFTPDKQRPRFSGVQIRNLVTGTWDNVSVRDETDPEIQETENGAPVPRPILIVLLAAALLVGVPAAIKTIKLTTVMAKGLRAYTWNTAAGARNEGGYTYSYSLPDASGTPRSYKSPFLDSHTRLRGGKEFGRDLLRYSWRLPEFESTPIRVRVNPNRPEQAVLKPGISVLLVYQLTALMIILGPVALALPVLRDTLAHRKVAAERSWLIAIAFGFYLLSFLGASLYIPTWGYLLRTMPPAGPLLIWLLVSMTLFIFPNVARRLYAYRVVRRTLYFLFFTGLLPLLLVAAGLALPYVIAVIVLVMALIVLIKPLARVGHTPLYALLIALVWVPVYVSGFLAPSRALVQLLHELMPYMPYNLSLTGIENPRLMAGLDLLFGFSGIVVSVLATYMDSLWRTRQAAQVDILPTSRARSVALGLVELEGRAQHVSPGTAGPVLYYNSRSPGRNRKEPFYLEDTTGRILIDPRATHLRTRARTSLGGRLTETVLKNREQLPDLTHPHVMTLEPGDPVYVIGTAQENPDAPAGATGSDRLIVRRRKGSVFAAPLWQASQGKIKPGHAVEDILFITDSAEANARSRIMRGIRQIWVWALLWIALGLSLIHFQLPRSRPGYALWTLPEIIRYAAPADRLEAVLTFIDRETVLSADDAASRLLHVKDVPHLGPFLETINRNMLLAQLGEGIHFLWQQKFKTPSPKEIELLVQAAGAHYSDVRHWAVNRMGHLTDHPRQAVPVLIAALASDPDMVVRTTAATTLSKFKKEAFPAIPALVDAARSTQPKLRYRAVNTVSRLPDIPPGPAHALFLEMLTDKEGWVRQAGVIGLRNMARHTRQDADALLVSTTDQDHYVRSLSIGTLGSIRPDDPVFATAVLRALQDEKTLVRHTAVRAAADLKILPDAAAAPLGAMIDDPAVSSRILSLLVTMQDRAAPAVPHLAAALAHKDRKVAYNAAFALSRVGSPAAGAVAELTAALSHADTFVRRYSADALGASGRAAQSSLADLKQLQSDPDAYVRGAARRAVARIQNAGD